MLAPVNHATNGAAGEKNTKVKCGWTNKVMEEGNTERERDRDEQRMNENDKDLTTQGIICQQ